MPQKAQIAAAFDRAQEILVAQGILPRTRPVSLMRTKDKTHGDLATNLAMTLAKDAGLSPHVLAGHLVDALPLCPLILRTEIAGAGFVNVFLQDDIRTQVIRDILTQGHQFGRHAPSGKRVQVEFVSANPTSSLHVGHGRGAAFGASLCNLLEACGHEVWREYYVNDAGRQMDILATSTYLRYLEAAGIALPAFPQNAYRGDYVKDFGHALFKQEGHKHILEVGELYGDVPADEADGGDKETHIDAIIAATKTHLGDSYALFLDHALGVILDDIEDDLRGFGVAFDEWYSEKSLAQKTQKTLDALDAAGHLYEKDGNIWFRATDFGDEKDRVVRRKNGLLTYFAADIAYHKDKFDRGFDQVIDVWGADHHGYIPRIKAALSALGIDASRFWVVLVQFVTLYRNGHKVQMSSRSGDFIPLRTLRHEVGDDAARFYYVSRKADVHMDFDLTLAKSQSKDNAVYYIQYAHARATRVLEKANIDADTLKKADFTRLNQEDDLLKTLSAYPETLKRAADDLAPHVLAGYLKDLASAFHSWYNDTRILDEDETLMHARLGLTKALKQVLANGLDILGLSAPKQM